MVDYNLDTEFRILDVPTVAASARQLRQEIELLPNGTIRTKLSGRSYSTARPQFNKFKTMVYFEDLWSPAFAGLWRGARVTIHSAQELPQPQRVGALPIRPVVPGTLRYLDADLNEVAANSPAAVFFTYCPVLEMFVVSWNLAYDEWGQVCTGDIEFSEVAPVEPGA